MNLGDVRCPVFGIGGVNVCPGILRTFPILQHAHDILCNIYADGTAQSMVIESDITLVIHARNVAGIIRCVTDISTAAITGYIPHNVRICSCELICRLHRYRRGLHIRGHLIHGQHMQVTGLTFCGTSGNCGG